MAFGDLKVQDLIYEDGSNNEITVVLSNLATKASPAFTGTVTGVNLTLSGDLQVNGTTTTINTTTLQVEDKNIEIGKVSSPSDTTADGGGWSLLGATTKTFNWVNATDAWTSSEHLHLLDDKKLLLGTSSECTFFHDNAGHTYLTTSTGNFHIQCPAGENSIRAIPNGAVQLYYDNSKKFETFSGGVKINGGLQLIDDGTNNIWRGGTQTNWIQSDGNTYITKNLGTEYLAKFNTDGAVELYCDNSKKFETTSVGSTLSGDLLLDSASAEINLKSGVGTESGAINWTFNTAGTNYARISLPYGTRATLGLNIHSGYPITLTGGNSNETLAKFTVNGSNELYYDNSKKFETTASGVSVTGTLTSTGGLSDSTAAKLYREIDNGSATVGPGWVTIAENTSNRQHGEIFVSDSESSDHAFIRIDWMRSFNDSNLTVINCGGHHNRITGVRVLEDSDITYGNKKLQVYVTISSNYKTSIKQIQNQNNWGNHTKVTPIVQNTISGYTVQDTQLENLDTYSLATAEGIQAGGAIRDSKGDLRSIPQNAQTGTSGNYVCVASDAGKHILRSGNGVNFPSNVFAAGTAITVINNSASDMNMVPGSGVTLYNTADGQTGQRVLAARGMATVIYTTAGANVDAYISGAGLS